MNSENNKLRILQKYLEFQNILQIIDERKQAVHKISFSFDHQKGGEIRSNGTVAITKKIQMPYTKKCHFLKKYSEFQNKSLNNAMHCQDETFHQMSLNCDNLKSI